MYTALKALMLSTASSAFVLTPSSGDTTRHTALSMRRHSQLRTLLVEAAWQLIRRDPALTITVTHKTNEGHDAIIPVARKLLRKIRAVMLCEKMYLNGITGSLTSFDIEAPALPAAAGFTTMHSIPAAQRALQRVKPKGPLLYTQWKHASL